MKCVMAVVLLSVVGPAVAADEQWMFVAGSETGADFFVKPNSRKAVTEPRAEAFQVDTKHIRPNGEVRYVRHQVSKADCARGQGFLFEYSMDGQQLARNDFALRTNVTAADIANYVCTGKKA